MCRDPVPRWNLLRLSVFFFSFHLEHAHILFSSRLRKQTQSRDREKKKKFCRMTNGLVRQFDDSQNFRKKRRTRVFVLATREASVIVLSCVVVRRILCPSWNNRNSPIAACYSISLSLFLFFQLRGNPSALNSLRLLLERRVDWPSVSSYEKNGKGFSEIILCRERATVKIKLMWNRRIHSIFENMLYVSLKTCLKKT